MTFLNTLLLVSALIAPVAITAQTSTTPAAPAPQAQPATPAKPDGPVDWMDQWIALVSKATAENDDAAIKQLNKEFEQHVNQSPDSAARSLYTYPNPAQTTTPQPTAKAVAESTCVVVPKKKGWLATAKKQLEKMAKAQAAKADAEIGKATKDKVDPGVQDTTTSAIDQATQPQPCPPAKPAKQ